MAEISVTNLVKRLISAFEGHNLPKSVSDGCPREICIELESKFHGLPREDLRPDELKWLSENAVLLNDEAFHYFTPSLLCASLESAPNLDMDALLQNYIYYPGLSDYGNYNKHRLESFTAQQAEVICDVLGYWVKNKVIDPIWVEKIEKSFVFWQANAVSSRTKSNFI